jgi:hypothetical protein
MILLFSYLHGCEFLKERERCRQMRERGKEEGRKKKKMKSRKNPDHS